MTVAMTMTEKKDTKLFLKQLPKAGMASSNVVCCHCPPAPSILLKSGWAIVHSAQQPFTPLHKIECFAIFREIHSLKP